MPNPTPLELSVLEALQSHATLSTVADYFPATDPQEVAWAVSELQRRGLVERRPVYTGRATGWPGV